MSCGRKHLGVYYQLIRVATMRYADMRFPCATRAFCAASGVAARCVVYVVYVFTCDVPPPARECKETEGEASKAPLAGP